MLALAHTGRSPRFAFDRGSSVRRTDADGRLHISSAVLSAACVSPYRGVEVPNFRELGLDADKTYGLLRDPDELRKAVSTFNNLPVLSRHVAVNAVDHHPELVCGSSGTDSAFDGSELENSLVIWTARAIAGIEDGTCDGLSCGYRYQPILESGTFEGKPWQLRMTRIVANHIALVSDPRVRSAVIGDSAAGLRRQREQNAALAAKYAPGIRRIKIGMS
jgi:hypothetical protein